MISSNRVCQFRFSIHCSRSFISLLDMTKRRRSTWRGFAPHQSVWIGLLVLQHTPGRRRSAKIRPPHTAAGGLRIGEACWRLMAGWHSTAEMLGQAHIRVAPSAATRHIKRSISAFAVRFGVVITECGPGRLWAGTAESGKNIGAASELLHAGLASGTWLPEGAFPKLGQQGKS